MSKKATASFSQGRGSIRHNNRDFYAENVNKELTPDNVTIIKIPLEQFYEDEFGEAVKEYNERQKRADRRIDSYMEHIKSSKNGENLFYENIVQVGNKDSHGKGEDREIAKKVLLEYASTWQERNPNLRCFNMVLHMDEATPHLHIDYVPVATGYKNGLWKRNSLDKAFKQQGDKPKKVIEKNGKERMEFSYEAYNRRERDFLISLYPKYDLELEEVLDGRKKETVQDYKAMMREIDKKIAQIKPYEVDAKDSFLSKDKVVLKREDFDNLKEAASLKITAGKEADALYQEAEKTLSMAKSTARSMREEAEKDKKDAFQVLCDARDEKAEINHIRYSLVEEKKKYEEKYQKQLQLNKLYNAEKSKTDALSKEIESLKHENGVLRYTVNELKRGIRDLSQTFNYLLEDAPPFVRKTVKAVQKFIASLGVEPSKSQELPPSVESNIERERERGLSR